MVFIEVRVPRSPIPTLTHVGGKDAKKLFEADRTGASHACLLHLL